MVEIYFVRQVIEDDLRHVGRQDVPRILKKLAILETDALAGMPLGGELTGFRKLVVGRNCPPARLRVPPDTYRIVYRVTDGGKVVEVCEVWAVGHRRNDEVYLEATRRVRQAATARPELLSLAELMATVSQLGAAGAAPEPPPDPVPEWLYKQLVHTAGIPPQNVAAMSGEEAFVAWNEWMSHPR